jgi:hypothetical protein
MKTKTKKPHAITWMDMQIKIKDIFTEMLSNIAVSVRWPGGYTYHNECVIDITASLGVKSAVAFANLKRLSTLLKTDFIHYCLKNFEVVGVLLAHR